MQSTDTRPIDHILRPFKSFAGTQTSGGIVLIASAVAAMIWANAAPGHYTGFFQQILSIGAGSAVLAKPLLLWINDALMSVFFFVVGLEIKREIIEGELSSIRQAALPIAGALGGMVLPALVYISLNAGGPGANGWGIPMATDIAFAVGILALLGSRVPAGLKVFLTALAIVDDIGAVLVIAVFYTEQISLGALVGGGTMLLLSIGANLLRIRHFMVYFVLGSIVWLLFLKSGVHATIAAILMAFTIPVRTRIDVDAFKKNVLENLSRMHTNPSIFMNEENADAVHTIETSCEAVTSPAQRLEHGLHGFVAFVVMPVFALANAGVSLNLNEAAALFSAPVSLGIVLGLFLGKQAGIFLFSWICLKLRLASLPSGVTLSAIYGASLLGGIGFTMSLFIAGLALPAELLPGAKAGILAGSLLSGIAGFVVLRAALGTQENPHG